MTQPVNPYQPPKATLDTGAETSGDIEKVASGQKMVIYSIVLNLVTMALQMAVGAVAGLVGIGAIVLALIGIFRIGSGMELSLVVKILLVILMFVPLVNLLTLVVLNARATARLRDAGYRVGLFGASR